MAQIPIQFPTPMQELRQAIAAVAQEGWGTLGVRRKNHVFNSGVVSVR
jgi:hypothetical protein